MELLEYFINVVLVLGAGVFAVGTTIILAQDKQKKIDRYVDNLPSKREEVTDHFQKKPLTGKGQFDKQRTPYTEGDNT